MPIMVRILPVALIAILPAFFLYPGGAQSLRYNLPWTEHFASALLSGDLYPRWMGTAFNGLGSPVFYFQPPLAFWMSGTFSALGVPALGAINLAGLCFSIAAGIAMFLWLRSIKANAPLGAALFMLAPYHFFDFYVRGALAEFAALAWIPLIALGQTHRLNRLTALAWCGLLITHLPTALLVGCFLAVPIAIRHSHFPAAAYGTGTALAAFYLLPALTLQDQVSIGHLWSAYYRPSAWSIWNRSDILFLVIQCSIALGAILLAGRNFWGGLTLIAGIMALGVVPWVWNLAPFYQVQFPWRLLGVVEFTAITSLMLNPPSKLRIALAAQFILLPYVTIALLAVAPTSAPKPESPAEYLPAGVDVSMLTNVNREIDLAPYADLPRTERIDVERPGVYSFGRFSFPIWQVERNGDPVASSGPAITFVADRPGEYRIVRRTMWQEIAGYILSLIALAYLLLCKNLTFPQWRRSTVGPGD